MALVPWALNITDWRAPRPTTAKCSAQKSANLIEVTSMVGTPAVHVITVDMRSKLRLV